MLRVNVVTNFASRHVKCCQKPWLDKALTELTRTGIIYKVYFTTDQLDYLESLHTAMDWGLLRADPLVRFRFLFPSKGIARETFSHAQAVHQEFGKEGRLTASARQLKTMIDTPTSPVKVKIIKSKISNFRVPDTQPSTCHIPSSFGPPCGTQSASSSFFGSSVHLQETSAVESFL